ncbi:MAG: response regulator, partial [Aeromonas veronii]
MNQGNTHILVVDDHSEIRDLLKRFLEQHGLRVSCARDGKEMKRLLEEREFDLLVLDLMMPGEDGLTLCRELRVKSNLPIIMLTAMGEETDRIIGLEMGADDYLAKP